MKRGLSGVLAAATLMFSGLAAANRGDVDVVLPVSPEIWGTAKAASTRRRHSPATAVASTRTKTIPKARCLKWKGKCCSACVSLTPSAPTP